MTMAAEIKNRVGPPAAAQPGAAGDINFCISVSVFSSLFDICIYDINFGNSFKPLAATRGRQGWLFLSRQFGLPMLQFPHF